MKIIWFLMIFENVMISLNLKGLKKIIKWSKKLMMFYENVMISYEFWGFVLRFFVIFADVFII